VVRRLRDVGQKFSANRRTLVLTAPAIEMPPELVSLVEFLDLPLPDRDRLREIIRETYTRMAGTHTLKLQLDSNGVDAMAANLRGLTEEAAERAISQTVVGRQALSPECITDVLDAKKALLKRSEMLEFVDSTDNMASVGGLDNLLSHHKAATLALAWGGRVLGVTALGNDAAEAQAKAYAAVDRIDWKEGFCRRDIGWRALRRG